MKTCLISVEGVLRNESRVPIDEGQSLYHCLRQDYKLLLQTNSNSEEITRWLGVHGFKDHFNVYTYPDGPSGELVMRTNQLYKIRNDGEKVILAIDANPEVVAMYSRDGIASLLFLSPKYSAPKYRPDYDGKVRAWDKINQEMAEQYEARNRWKDAYAKELVE